MVERLRSKGLRFAGSDPEAKEESEEPEPGESRSEPPPLASSEPPQKTATGAEQGSCPMLGGRGIQEDRIRMCHKLPSS